MFRFRSAEQVEGALDHGPRRLDGIDVGLIASLRGLHVGLFDQPVDVWRKHIAVGVRCGMTGTIFASEGAFIGGQPVHLDGRRAKRSEEHTSELQSLMRISYAVFCLKKKKKDTNTNKINIILT